MQAKGRSGMVATDDYAEPIANLLRIIATPLNRAILFSGELGRGPRCCFHASSWIKAKASDKHAQHHEPHSILSTPIFGLQLASALVVADDASLIRPGRHQRGGSEFHLWAHLLDTTCARGTLRCLVDEGKHRGLERLGILPLLTLQESQPNEGLYLWGV